MDRRYGCGHLDRRPLLLTGWGRGGPFLQGGRQGRGGRAPAGGAVPLPLCTDPGPADAARPGILRGRPAAEPGHRAHGAGRRALPHPPRLRAGQRRCGRLQLPGGHPCHPPTGPGRLCRPAAGGIGGAHRGQRGRDLVGHLRPRMADRPDRPGRGRGRDVPPAGLPRRHGPPGPHTGLDVSCRRGRAGFRRRAGPGKVRRRPGGGHPGIPAHRQRMRRRDGHAPGARSFR